MSFRLAALLALPLLAACRPTAAPAPSTAPPVRLQSDVPPREALRSAADYLGHSGFLVVRTDSLSRLRAEREHRPGEFGDALTCRDVSTPAARLAVVPTMIIDLAALPATGGGSELVVTTRVNADYLRLSAAPARPSSDRDCRSTGVVERGLAARISRGQ